jgi:hypothetical protein
MVKYQQILVHVWLYQLQRGQLQRANYKEPFTKSPLEACLAWQEWCNLALKKDYQYIEITSNFIF